MPNQRNGCPPCKIILDGRVIAASARRLGEVMLADADLSSAANYLADIATGSVEATIHGIRSGALQHDQVDEAHAFSELSCHRAKVIRDAADGTFSEAVAVNAEVIMGWAEELRLFTTALVGGEYDGAWEVDGVAGIRRKDVNPG